MSSCDRREFLQLTASGLAVSALPSLHTPAYAQTLTFTPVRMPQPLPIYQQSASYQATGIGSGNTLAANNDTKLANFAVVDDLVVPPEFERFAIVGWGDKVFSDTNAYVGYNISGVVFQAQGRSQDVGWLTLTHQSVSFPISGLAPETPSDVQSLATSFATVIGRSLPVSRNLEVNGEFLYNLGASVVLVSRRNLNRTFVPVTDIGNRRLHGLSGLGINASRTAPYQTVTAWGALSHQQGDQNYLEGTGPAATQVFNLSSDGLGNQIIGTFANSYATMTPWGTVLTGEGLFAGGGAFFLGVTEAVRPDGTQTVYTAGTVGETFGLVGEKYGWAVEFDPTDATFRPKKHTAFGRIRHGGLALRAVANQRLVVYLTDQRRGGHVWKFVSNNSLGSDLTDRANSALLGNGTLYVAKFNSDGTGEWIPLLLTTATNPLPPTTISSVEFAALGAAQRNGLLPLPRRNGIAGQTTDGGSFSCTRTNEATAFPGYQNKTLQNFYTSTGAILCDAFLAANLVGGTPSAFPQGVAVHPTTREVFIAFRDGSPGGDGYPDSRIFQVAKLSSDANATQQFGGIYKITEDSADGTGTTFTWSRFAQGSEAGAVAGAGFVAPRSLTFDREARLWLTTDIPTSVLNGFNTGAAGTQVTINHSATGNVSTFQGVMGNNGLFCIPTSGSDTGQVQPFGYGPVRSGLVGVTFVGDTLLTAVQHPGEDCPINDGTQLNRNIETLDLNGTTFNQTRNVPRGSSFPSNLPTAAGGDDQATGVPRPVVMGIRRRRSIGKFV